MAVMVDEIMGPGFLVFFQIPGSPGGPISGEGAATTSLFKSEYTLDRIYEEEDDEILAIIMAFMFTRK